MSFIRFFSNLLLILILINIQNTFSCTNFIVTKGASVDGSTMISYNADAGGFMEPLYFLPAADHKEDSVEVYDWDTRKYLGNIKQIPHTYAVIGLMNEYQVSLGETTYGGREELRDTTARVDYGSLMFLALQRAKTAREAIQVMGGLVKEYGYYSEGESMSVADPEEAWIFEIIGKGPKEKGAVWAARRIPDGYVAAHANQSRIREILPDEPENCMFAPDVIDFAVKKGYYDPKSGKPFSFCDAYNPLNPEGLMFCEGRVWRMFSRVAPSQNFSDDYWRAVKGAKPYPLFIKPDKKLSVRDVQSLMRDHFEGTPYDMTKGLAAGPYCLPYRWKPLMWKLKGDTINEYGWERPISTQQTAFSFVAQMRSFMPREIAGVFWYGVDDTYSNVYMPLYCSMSKCPKSLREADMTNFTTESAAWLFNLVANIAYTKYSYVIKDIQPVQKSLEDKFEVFQPAVEKTALELYDKNPKLAVDYLSDYSDSQVNLTVETWKNLWKKLVMKYNDGYINDVSKEHGRAPASSGYSDDYYRELTKDRPGYYNVKWQEKGNEVNEKLTK